MKLVGMLLLSALAVGCNNTESKLSGKATGGATASEAKGGGNKSELLAAVQRIDERLKSLETSHNPGPGGGSTLERIHRIEASLARREEALGFLEMAYTQQKQQQEQQEANEPDPDAVFAVDISKALAAGQVEGASSALITIVEAWDFA